MLESLFQSFLQNKVDPKKNAVTQASETLSRMQGLIEAKLEEGNSLPSLLNDQHFPFGSAVRGTQAAPFDDVDLMLVLDGSCLHAIEGGTVVGTAYGSGSGSSILLSSQYLDANGLVSSQKILNRIRSVVAETYTRSSIRKDGQAINVWLDSYDFGIDIVPAIKIHSPTRGDHYYIPFGTNSDMWLPTNPHADLSAFKNGDLALNQFLLPTARLMRKWNEVNNANRLSGFHVDALTYHALNGKDIRSLNAALTTCFFAFGNLLGYYIPQFSGLGTNIDHRLSSEDRQKSIAAAQDAYGRLTALGGLGLLGVNTRATAEWNEIFGGQLL